MQARVWRQTRAEVLKEGSLKVGPRGSQVRKAQPHDHLGGLVSSQAHSCVNDVERITSLLLKPYFGNEVKR